MINSRSLHSGTAKVWNSESRDPRNCVVYGEVGLNLTPPYDLCFLCCCLVLVFHLYNAIHNQSSHIKFPGLLTPAHCLQDIHCF